MINDKCLVMIVSNEYQYLHVIAYTMFSLELCQSSFPPTFGIDQATRFRWDEIMPCCQQMLGASRVAASFL